MMRNIEGTILDYFEDTASKYPDKIAYSDDAEKLTFAELKMKARCLATAIAHETIPGQAVAIWMNHRSIEYQVARLGIWYAGCISIAVDTGTPTAIVVSVLKKFDDPIIIFDDNFRHKIERNAEAYRSYLFNELCASPFDDELLKALRNGIKAENPLDVLLTSGTTGTPKCIMLSHINCIGIAKANIWQWNLTDKTVFGGLFPMFFGGGLQYVFCPLINGSSAYVFSVDSSDPDFSRYLYQAVSENGITMLSISPPYLEYLLKYAENHALPDLSKLEVLFSCGQAINKAMVRRVFEVFNTSEFYISYGASECQPISYYRLYGPEDFREGCIGKVIKDCEVQIIDLETHKICPVGQDGALCAYSKNIFMGYVGDKEKTEERQITDAVNSQSGKIFLNMGDVAHFDENGFLYISGRSDNQIKYHGFRINLEGIERCAENDPNVDACAILFDASSDQLVCFWSGALSKLQMRKLFGSQIPRYAIPAKYIHLDEMPVNQRGKTDRRILREMLKDK